MTNLPITNETKKLLRKEPYTNGVWSIEGKGRYVKSTAKISPPPVKIPAHLANEERYKNPMQAAMVCAKVYKKLTELGMYPPGTDVVIYKEDGNLGLMVVMPKLEPEENCLMDNSIIRKAKSLEERLGISVCKDLYLSHNWGRQGESCYAHDLHVACDYRQMLDIAEKIGIKVQDEKPANKQ